ncbi:hypothetical protein WJX82_010407 [Trebouxia sp. C0006]
MIIQSLLISCRLQVSKVNSHSKRENRQPLQQGLPTKFFADRLQVLITHLGLLPFLQLVTSQYNRQTSAMAAPPTRQMSAVKFIFAALLVCRTAVIDARRSSSLEKHAVLSTSRSLLSYAPQSAPAPIGANVCPRPPAFSRFHSGASVTYDRSTNMSRSVCILLILAVAAFSADANRELLAAVPAPAPAPGPSASTAAPLTAPSAASAPAVGRRRLLAAVPAPAPAPGPSSSLAPTTAPAAASAPSSSG